MTAELLLEAALADGIENGHPPAPGFIDVMEACSLSQLRPQERDLQALLDHVDPQKEIQNATAALIDTLGHWHLWSVPRLGSIDHTI
ncbi:hypothetical protein [Rhizobium leguminosarum]|uniref:hypothetical protein n=1 Tax=Rhizobium leguminosarum TaxID=384 RepID=UPI001FEE7710|nr:hypothetical protein [Rhizobium leguminosarum]